MSRRVTFVAGVASVFPRRGSVVPFVSVPVASVSVPVPIPIPVAVPVPIPVVVPVAASVVVVVRTTGFPVARCYYFDFYVGRCGYLFKKIMP